MLEAERLARLHALGILDTPPEERFDRIARLAARILGAPIATITFLDGDRQWFKAVVGLEDRETERAVSFCAHAVEADAPLVVEDASTDRRFATNRLVTGSPHIRFYAGHPVRTPDGVPLGTVCAIDTVPRAATAEELDALRDLAALVELELSATRVSEALLARREEEARVRAVLEAAPTAGLALGAAGRVERCNPAAEALLGRPADELLGRTLADLLGEEAEVVEGEIEITRPDGRRVVADLRRAAIEVDDRRLGEVVTLADATERAALQRARDEFVRLAAHELRTPLTSLRGYAEELLDEETGVLGDDQRTAVEAVKRNADRLAQLTEDLLLVLRLESGRLAVEPSDIDLAALAGAAADDASARAARAGVVIDLDADAPVRARGDARVLGRAVAGLLEHGLGEAGRGGHVHVTATRRDGEAVVVVEDDGPGVAPAELTGASTPFRRGATSGPREGTGLGLAIARAGAEAHGGRLELESAQGHGTRVTLVLGADG